MLTFAFGPDGATLSVRDIYVIKERGQKSPSCFCPACRHELIAKLGAEVAHHFAHRPQPKPCFGSTSEGELHISAKAFLQRQLQFLADMGGALQLEGSCRSCERSMLVPAVILQPGDRVLVETWIDPRKTRKPDVSIYRGDTLIGLIEVLVTHACEPQKLSELKALGVPMVEARGKAILDQHQIHETNLQIPFVRALGVDIPRLCPPCLEAERKQREQQERATADWEAEQELWRITPKTEIFAHCYVNFFLKDGRRLQRIFIIERQWEKGIWASATLTESMTKQHLDSWGELVAANREELLHQARERARDFCRQQKSEYPAQIEAYGGFKFGALDNPPFPERWWHSETSQWVRVRFERSLAYWLGIREETLANMLNNGRLRRIEVKPYAAAEKTHSAIEAEGVERFEKWLKRKRATEPTSFRRRRYNWR